MKHKPTTRKCAECGESFKGAGRQLTCSPKCSQERLSRQLKALTARRGEESKARLRLTCEVCGIAFDARHSAAKYCSDPCRAQGQLKAIRRQRAYRAENFGWYKEGV